MSEPRPHQIPRPGAVHAELVGSTEGLQFRPKRLATDGLTFQVTCRFSVDGQELGPLPVLNISPTGIAIDPQDKIVLTPGTPVEDLRIAYRDSAVWNGSAVAIYQVEGPSSRVGLRFTTRLFDLQLLELRDELIENRLETELDLQSRYARELPPDWRAAVTTLRLLLEGVKEVLDEAEHNLRSGPAPQEVDERELFEKIFEKWGPRFHGQLGKLSEQTTEFDAETTELARSFATRELLPLFYSCPMYRRVYEKPLGYAGDYQLMIYYFTDTFSGDTLYDRFLHFTGQNYPHSQAILDRERLTREAVRSVIEREMPARVVSLACGPAIEIQRLLGEIDDIKKPLELVLIDQDEQTMHYCHDAVSREIVSRQRDWQALIELNCLHLSIRQIIKPKDETEKRFVASVLKDVDLIYSIGLYDYLPETVARALTTKLHNMLVPGGRLLIGNFSECPVSTWLGEYVLSWHLVYRTPESMLDLTTKISPEPAKSEVISDDTGLCLFLDIVRSSD
jgi:extracellular factor (EF) 3-hydroxypalmitic acid methyl ester biosynthesis protein